MAVSLFTTLQRKRAVVCFTSEPANILIGFDDGN